MIEAAEVRQNNPKTAFEREDWPLGPVGLVYLGIFLFLVITPLVLILAYPSAVSDVGRGLAIKPPAPELQIDPAQDLANLRAAEDRRLNTYYWVDKQKGIVHIPIEQAMKKIAASGIPGFPSGRP
jgi:hypothetical protein